MIPDCDRRSDKRSDGQTESIIAKTALCIASYADALSIKPVEMLLIQKNCRDDTVQKLPKLITIVSLAV